MKGFKLKCNLNVRKHRIEWRWNLWKRLPQLTWMTENLDIVLWIKLFYFYCYWVIFPSLFLPFPQRKYHKFIPTPPNYCMPHRTSTPTRPNPLHPRYTHNIYFNKFWFFIVFLATEAALLCHKPLQLFLFLFHYWIVILNTSYLVNTEKT